MVYQISQNLYFVIIPTTNRALRSCTGHNLLLCIERLHSLWNTFLFMKDTFILCQLAVAEASYIGVADEKRHLKVGGGGGGCESS